MTHTKHRKRRERAQRDGLPHLQPKKLHGWRDVGYVTGGWTFEYDGALPNYSEPRQYGEDALLFAHVDNQYRRVLELPGSSALFIAPLGTPLPGQPGVR